MSGDKELLVGQNLSLSCTYLEAVSLRWEKVGGSLPSRASQTSGGTNNNLSQLLLIPELNEQDSGQYFCQANTSDGQVMVSVAVSVTVLGEPIFGLVLYIVRCIFPLLSLLVRSADRLQCEEERRVT